MNNHLNNKVKIKLNSNLQAAMLNFFLRTSIPRMINLKKSEKENN